LDRRRVPPANSTHEQEAVFCGIGPRGERAAVTTTGAVGRACYGLALSHPFHVESRQLAKFLLPASGVALGFGMNLHEVLQAGRTGFLYTALSISLTMLLGLASAT